MDWAEFALARIAEDEAAALRASPGPWSPNAEHDEVVAVDGITVADGFALSNRQLRATVNHIARHDPARVMADCAAKRAIVAEHATQNVPVLEVRGEIVMSGPECRTCVDWDKVEADGPSPAASPCRTVRLLLQAWSDHPDFDPAWGVDEPARSG